MTRVAGVSGGESLTGLVTAEAFWRQITITGTKSRNLNGTLSFRKAAQVIT